MFFVNANTIWGLIYLDLVDLAFAIDLQQFIFDLIPQIFW
mgnify:CR=1 FL=1